METVQEFDVAEIDRELDEITTISTDHNEDEGFSYEQERRKPMPSKTHAVVQMNIGDALIRYKHHYRRLAEVAITDASGNTMVPDIAVYPIHASNWYENESAMKQPPLLAIEIESLRFMPAKNRAFLPKAM